MVFEIMRPFLMFGIEFHLSYSILVLFYACIISYLYYFILVLFFLLFLFDDAVVTLLARLHGVRMC